MAQNSLVGEINARLKEARKAGGFSLRSLHMRLKAEGLPYSYSSARNWEGDGEPRMPPADYVAGVATVCNVRGEWLLTGTGPIRTEEVADQRLFEKARFSKAVLRHVLEVSWGRLDVSLRSSVFRILSEVERTVPAVAPRGEPSREVALRAMVAYLNALVPQDDRYFVPMARLTPREREHVTLHVRGLVSLLFRPFLDADRSFVWSRVLEGLTNPRPEIKEEGPIKTTVKSRVPGLVAEQAMDTAPKDDRAHLSVRLRDGEVVAVRRDARLEAELKARLEALETERDVITFTTLDGRARDLSPSDVVYFDVSVAAEASTRSPKRSPRRRGKED